MNIIEKRIDELIMYENNPKIHTDEQINKIAKSIELTKGLRQPIVIDKNNVIVVGHGRVQAAMQLGLETVPCELADDLTDEEIRAYRLIDNELAKGESDLDLLEQELASLNDIDMGEFFDDEKIETEIDEKSANNQSQRKEVNYSENISIIIDCDDDEQAEQIYNQLTEDGYRCRISTL